MHERTAPLIFAFVEDGTLEIHDDLASVQRAYEGVDVEAHVVRFYNDAGVYLEPRFIVPNRSGKTLGLVSWVASGVFELVPNPKAEHDPFALAIDETTSLAPNRWFSSLEQLKTALAAAGVSVAVRHEDGNTT